MIVNLGSEFKHENYSEQDKTVHQPIFHRLYHKVKCN